MSVREEFDLLNAEVEKNKGDLARLTRRITAELNVAVCSFELVVS